MSIRKRADSSTYQSVVRVPMDLVGIIGKSQIQKSLGTANRTEAKRLDKIHVGECERLFEQHRASRRAAEAEKARIAAAVEQERMIIESPQFKALKSTLIRIAQQHGIPASEEPVITLTNDPDKPYTVHWPSYGREELNAITDEIGVAVEVEQHSGSLPLHIRERVEAYTRELIDADRSSAEAARKQLESMGTPNATTVEEHSLAALMALWIAERKPEAKTIHEMKLAIQRFIAANGDVPFPSINSEHARTFKSHILSLDVKSPFGKGWR